MGWVAIEIDTARAAMRAASKACRGALPSRAQLPRAATFAAGTAVLWIELRIDAALIAVEQPAAARVARAALSGRSGLCARAAGIPGIGCAATAACPCISLLVARARTACAPRVSRVGLSATEQPGRRHQQAAPFSNLAPPEHHARTLLCFACFVCGAWC